MVTTQIIILTCVGWYRRQAHRATPALPVQNQLLSAYGHGTKKPGTDPAPVVPGCEWYWTPVSFRRILLRALYESHGTDGGRGDRIIAVLTVCMMFRRTDAGYRAKWLATGGTDGVYGGTRLAGRVCAEPEAAVLALRMMLP
eukprot:968660-Rhodomonas_salina.1